MDLGCILFFLLVSFEWQSFVLFLMCSILSFFFLSWLFLFCILSNKSFVAQVHKDFSYIFFWTDFWVEIASSIFFFSFSTYSLNCKFRNEFCSPVKYIKNQSFSQWRNACNNVGKFDSFVTINAHALPSLGYLLPTLLVWMFPQTNPETRTRVKTVVCY